MTAVGIAGFQTAVRSVYPTLLPAEQSTDIAFGPQSLDIKQGAPVWRMVDEGGQWTLGISAAFVSLETPNYTNIDEFLERVSFVLKALRRTIRPAESNRIGLRKINVIDADEYANDLGQLATIVRRDLLGPLGVSSFPAKISANFSQLEFADSFNSLVARYGLGTKDGRDGFVLDLDYSTEQPYTVDGDRGLLDLLRYFSDGMTSFFHWSITEEYKKRLEPSARSEWKSAE